MHFVINFVSKLLREQMFEYFWCIISLILCKSLYGRSNCYISFIIDFVRKMISLVNASESGMCGVLPFVLFFH